MPDEFQNQQSLREARLQDRREKARETLKKYSTGKNKGVAQKTINSAKDFENFAKSATPWGIFSLLREFSLFSDWMYGVALFFAFLKDLLDLLNLTGIGYIIVFVATVCCSLLIMMMMLLGSFSNGYGRKQQNIIRAWLTLGGGTVIELIPGVGFLPVETFIVLAVYFMFLSARKTAREEQEQEKRLGNAQEAYA